MLKLLPGSTFGSQEIIEWFAELRSQRLAFKHLGGWKFPGRVLNMRKAYTEKSSKNLH